jgi:hypothetical protein
MWNRIKEKAGRVGIFKSPRQLATLFPCAQKLKAQLSMKKRAMYAYQNYRFWPCIRTEYKESQTKLERALQNQGMGAAKLGPSPRHQTI